MGLLEHTPALKGLHGTREVPLRDVQSLDVGSDGFDDSLGLGSFFSNGVYLLHQVLPLAEHPPHLMALLQQVSRGRMTAKTSTTSPRAQDDKLCLLPAEYSPRSASEYIPFLQDPDPS